MDTRIAVAGLVLAVTTGCFEVPGEEDCDTSAASSVTVSVWDAFGDPVRPDGVFYDVDGLGEVPCDAIDDNAYVCGWEETGHFVIRVSVDGLDWYEELDVGLRADGCHVDSTFVDVVVD